MCAEEGVLSEDLGYDQDSTGGHGMREFLKQRMSKTKGTEQSQGNLEKDHVPSPQ